MPDDQPASPGLDPVSRYEALLRVSRAIARHTSVAELLRAISEQLHLVVPFDYLMLVLHDAQMDEMRLVVLEPSDAPFAPFVSMPLSDWGPARSVWETQRTLVVPLQMEPLLGTPLEFLRGHGAQATCWLPLTTAHRQVGVLTFGSRHADQYAADAVAFMEQVAAHVAIAVDNAINFDDAQRLQGELRDERDRLRLILDMNNLLVSRLDYP
jgi:formate hydrogenlyase transcriptional activator